MYSSGLGGLAQATVSGLPADNLKPEEPEVAEIPKVGKVLPPHTTPSQVFGKEVGLVYEARVYSKLGV